MLNLENIPEPKCWDFSKNTEKRGKRPKTVFSQFSQISTIGRISGFSIEKFGWSKCCIKPRMCSSAEFLNHDCKFLWLILIVSDVVVRKFFDHVSSRNGDSEIPTHMTCTSEMFTTGILYCKNLQLNTKSVFQGNCEMMKGQNFEISTEHENICFEEPMFRFSFLWIFNPQIKIMDLFLLSLNQDFLALW